jgi:hypothetical protein
MDRTPLSFIAKVCSYWASARLLTAKVTVNTIASTNILVIISPSYDGSGEIDTRYERERPSSYGVVALSFGGLILEEAPSVPQCKPSTGNETIQRSAWKVNSPNFAFTEF